VELFDKLLILLAPSITAPRVYILNVFWARRYVYFEVCWKDSKNKNERTSFKELQMK
jgi:hypothetical protein